METMGMGNMNVSQMQPNPMMMQGGGGMMFNSGGGANMMGYSSGAQQPGGFAMKQ